MTLPPRVAARTPVALHALLEGAIDYAGLFPPAHLDMRSAAVEYESYLRSDDAWALGRFIVPAARLDEMAAAANAVLADRGSSAPDLGPWRLSALLGADVATDVARVREFTDRTGVPREGGWRGTVDAVELRAASEPAIRDAAAAVGRDLECYIEIPTASDPAPLVRAIGRAGARAKVRTGGTTGDAFPSTSELLSFLAACVAARVPFKATAGLHHPLRGAYALTYAADSARGTMFGFLNVFLAAAFLRAGADEEAARGVLEETSPDSLTIDDAGIAWRDHRLAPGEIAAARELAIASFGSCSFREPIDDLTALGLL